MQKTKIIAFVCTDEAIFSLINVIKFIPDNIPVKFCTPNSKFFKYYPDAHRDYLTSLAFKGDCVPANFLGNKIKHVESLPNSIQKYSSLDLMIFTSPYFMTRSEYHPAELAKKNIHTAYFPYGTEFMGKGYDKWIVCQSHVDDVSLLFTSSPLATEHYTRIRGNLANICSVGNPELDILYNKTYEKCNSYQKFENFKSGSYTFLYIPHWSVYSEPWWSSFLEFGPVLHDFFHRHQAYRLLIRPHPCLFRYSSQMSLAVREKVFKLLSGLSELPNVMLDKSSSSIPAIGVADCLISDCSSIIQKFWPTGKPIIANNVDYGAADAAMSRCVDLVSSPGELLEAMLKQIEGEDPLFEARKNESYAFSGPYDGLCGKRMADVLINFLNKGS